MEEKIKTDLICIRTGSTMKMASDLMKEKRIRHLPIVNASGDIISILSKHDFTDVIKFDDMPVDVFSSSPVQSVRESEPLSRIALKMIVEKISALIICDDEKRVVGIITTDDLLLQFSQLIIEKDNQLDTKWNSFKTLTTIGEFVKSLADIGI